MYVDHPRLSGCRGCTGRNSRPASAARNAAPGACGRSSRRRRGRTGRAAALPGRRCTLAGCNTGFAAAATAAAPWLRAASACSRPSREEIRTAARIAPAQACSRAHCSSLSAWRAASPGIGQAASGPGSQVAGGSRPGGELADPAHPLGGRLGVVTGLLGHPADAAGVAAHGASDRRGHAFGGRSGRSLRRGGGQCLAPCVVHGQPGPRSPPRRCCACRGGDRLAGTGGTAAGEADGQPAGEPDLRVDGCAR